ncbi:MAG: hypothetical protein NTV29_05820 [Planctomycetota bacterium]|nr:hypothetical protein [Planctomycetota bacterium]
MNASMRFFHSIQPDDSFSNPHERSGAILGYSILGYSIGKPVLGVR